MYATVVLGSMKELYSQTYHGPVQKCTGKDQLMLARGPWEDGPILIRGVSLTHRVYPPTTDAFAMAGSSADSGDILIHVGGTGTAQLMYPEERGFYFPGNSEAVLGQPSGRCHIDVHAFCSKGHSHEVWLTLYYERQHVGEVIVTKPIPQNIDNDVLPWLAKTWPVYQPTPPSMTLREMLGTMRNMVWAQK